MRKPIFTRWASVAVVLISTTPSGAQSGADALFGVFGGMIAMAQVQAAQDAWARTSELKRYCLERAASARHRVTVAALIQKGISPNDPRLGAIASECLRFDPSMLKSDFACVTSEELGARVQTRCAQQFGRQDTFGRLQPLEPRAAVDLYFATGTFALAEVENEQGRQERLQRADEQRRMAEAQTLRTQIDAFRSSRSELVRSHAQSLIQKLSWNSPPVQDGD